MRTSKIWAFFLCLSFIGTGIISAQEPTDVALETTKVLSPKKALKKEKEAIRKQIIAEKIQKEKEESLNKMKVTRYTVMSSFEPDLVISADERTEIKKQRIEETYRKKELLDTMKISQRKRKKLLRDLRKTPFSERLNKVTVAETEFEDEEDLDLEK